MRGVAREDAERFLLALTGRPNQLEVLRTVSTFAPHATALATFCERELPALIRELPSVSHREPVVFEGGLRGRLDVSGTLRLHAEGRRTSFAGRTPVRSFNRPENILVRAVTERLLRALTDARQAGALPETGWAVDLRSSEGALRHLAASTVLREVALERITPYHEFAARHARHPTYRAALEWLERLRIGLDSDDPHAIADVIARGALSPLSPDTRFEIAVVLRLARAIDAHLGAIQPDRWSVTRALVMAGRSDLVSWARADGLVIRLYYNQAILPAGACDDAGRHYFTNSGRLRPDITLVAEREGRLVRATVFEVKHSDDTRYLLSGLQEAHLYRWEYAPCLTAWPKAVLVASSVVPGDARESDDVVAIGWPAWMGPHVVAGLLSEV